MAETNFKIGDILKNIYSTNHFVVVVDIEEDRYCHGGYKYKLFDMMDKLYFYHGTMEPVMYEWKLVA